MPLSTNPGPGSSLQASSFLPRATLAMGGIGAVIGATGAAARNIRQVKEAQMTKEEAVRDTLKESAGTGLATATATAVVGLAGAGGLFSLAGMLVVATGSKYLFDAATSQEKARTQAVEKSGPKPGTEKTQPSK
ncbi:MAG: hypothetical protein ACLFT8_00475 [Desulfovermiculus sp.]